MAYMAHQQADRLDLLTPNSFLIAPTLNSLHPNLW